MENDSAFAEILNDCLDAIEAQQASIEECLARYPQHAAQLEDLLRLSDHARMVPLPTPTPEMLAAGERQLVQAAQSKAAAGRKEQQDEGLLGVLSERLIEPAKARLRSLSRWSAPAVALSGTVVLLLACVLVAVIGGGTAWWAFRDKDQAPDPTSTAVPAIAVDQDALPLPSPTSLASQETASDQDVSLLPSPTSETDVVQDPTPDADSVHTVFLPSVISPLPPHRAMLVNARGVVEIKTDGDTWTRASARQIVEAGQRVRTGALSGGQIAFYDGSTASLGPDTEVSIDALGQDPDDQSRIVELTQWVGETDHDVAPAHGDHSRYEVRTPSGTGEAKGTLFHVLVTPALFTRFRVDEGAVTVTHLDVTVVVVAGQMTTIHLDHVPSEPVFRITGEGEVTATGDIWTIAGHDFETHGATVTVGDPQVGDWVFVEGHLSPEGARVADRIVLLWRSLEDRFTIIGPVEHITDTAWTVAGQVISVTEETDIEEGIDILDRVRVEGVVLEGGDLLAERIRLVAKELGSPFNFVGVAQEISDTYWVVSGISVTVDLDTVLGDDLDVGDVVQVWGRIVDDTWLARSITRARVHEREFEIIGEVESLAPSWVVSGIAFETRGWTEIDAGIKISDTVRVGGRIHADGTWVADEIRLLDDELLYVKFVGIVQGLDPWVVSGITLTVDAETEIGAGIDLGTLVRVKAEITPEGEWLAREIMRVHIGLGVGCMQFAAIVVRIDPDQVILQDGTTIGLDGGVQVDGELRANSVILVYLCVDRDGNVIVVSIIVIYQSEPVIPIPPRPPWRPPRDDDDDRGRRHVTICHHAQGESGERTTMVVGWPAWINAHSWHGDTLGPCR